MEQNTSRRHYTRENVVLSGCVRENDSSCSIDSLQSNQPSTDQTTAEINEVKDLSVIFM